MAVKKVKLVPMTLLIPADLKKKIDKIAIRKDVYMRDIVIAALQKVK